MHGGRGGTHAGLSLEDRAWTDGIAISFRLFLLFLASDSPRGVLRVADELGRGDPSVFKLGDP